MPENNEEPVGEENEQEESGSGEATEESGSGTGESTEEGSPQEETGENSSDGENEETVLTFDRFLTDELPSVRNTAKIIMDYNTELTKMEFNTTLVGKHNGLLNTIKSSLDREDPEERKKLLDVISEAFVVYKDEAFNNVKLFRFDVSWKWGEDSLLAVNALMMLFVTLADKETRKANSKLIDFERIYELEGLTPSQTSRLAEYFSV